MGNNTKFIIGILLIATIAFLTGAVALFFMRQAEIEKRVVLEKRLDEITKEKARLTKELGDVVAIKKDLEIKLVDAQAKVMRTEGQLESERKLKETTISQLEMEKKESKRLVDELMKLKDEKERIAANLEDIKGECDNLKTQLSTVQQAKEVVEGKLKEMLAKNEVELEKIVVKPETAADLNPQDADIPPDELPQTKTPPSPANPGLKGEVLVVNKKFDFAVISLGESDGMRPGMDIGIYRDKRLLARLKIEKVHANMSAATIPPEWKTADIKEGDTVQVVK